MLAPFHNSQWTLLRFRGSAASTPPTPTPPPHPITPQFPATATTTRALWQFPSTPSPKSSPAKLVMFLRTFLTSPITFLTSLSVSLSLTLTLRLCLVAEKWKGKNKWFFFFFFLSLSVFCCRENERKEKEKVIFELFFLFFEVDNFSFSLSFSDGLFGCRVKQREWKGKRKWKEFYDFRLELYDDIAWESVWLPRTKQRRKKSFFFPLSKALFGCWEMNFMTFVVERMKGKNRKSDFWTF